MQSGLEGKVVLVTGASGGIGSGIAQKFASEGSRLVLHYRTGRHQVEQLAHRLAKTELCLVGADLSREDEAKRLIAQARKKFGRIDTLIANAASWEMDEVFLHEMTARQWRRTMDGVLTSTFFTVREFLRVVASQRQGNLTLISSTAAVFGEAGHADYAAAKAAIAYGLTRTLKNEIARLAPHTKKYCGGRVNCVCPGWTVVPRVAGRLKQVKILRRLTSTMALPQLARPEDVASTVVFLSSDLLARHVTGQIMVVAGGMEGRKLWEEQEVDTRAV